MMPMAAAAKPASDPKRVAALPEVAAAAAAEVPDAAGPEVEEAAALLVDEAPAPSLTSVVFLVPQLWLHWSEPGF